MCIHKPKGKGIPYRRFTDAQGKLLQTLQIGFCETFHYESTIFFVLQSEKHKVF